MSTYGHSSGQLGLTRCCPCCSSHQQSCAYLQEQTVTRIYSAGPYLISSASVTSYTPQQMAAMRCKLRRGIAAIILPRALPSYQPVCKRETSSLLSVADCAERLTLQAAQQHA